MHFAWSKISLESATTASVKISHGFPPYEITLDFLYLN